MIPNIRFTSLFKDNGIKVSMDGKGYWRDNVFVERLWRSSNMKMLISTPMTAPLPAKQGLESYITKYNQIRPHSSLDRQTPDEFYFKKTASTTQGSLGKIARRFT